MEKVQGSASTQLIECINPKRDKWRIRWGKVSVDESNAEWYETDFDQKPTLEEVKDVVLAHYNSEIDKKILSGFEWKGNKVWLSSENQFNYKAAYDLAVQTAGATLPVTFKFGADEPIYYTFRDLDDFTDFYVGCMTFIQTTLNEGWAAKDAIDWEKYDVEEEQNG